MNVPTMQCPACQGEAPWDAAFCPSCGGRLTTLCPACGSANSLQYRFCTRCSERMAAAVPASPRAYTPRYLADRILSARRVLEGERKQVTVLCCDIVDSSRLAERLEPEVMHQVMGDALRLMAEAVHRYEGFVNQFLGGGRMALFGAPVALEDHALR